MHNYLVNASIQIIPIVTDKHPYDWVDEAIRVIQQSGIKYEVGPFSTTLEGTYDDVLKTMQEVNEFLFQRECSEWITNFQVQIRSKEDIVGSEKTQKFR